MNETVLERYKGSTEPLHDGCPLCPACYEARLLPCPKCSFVSYCDTEHLVSDRHRHRPICNGVNAGQIKLSKQESLLREPSLDSTSPLNPFDARRGSFWSFRSTRRYMCDRFNLAHNLLTMRSKKSVQEALYHLRDMIRLSQIDEMGLREIVPGVMLRLDFDQDAYDFVRSWAAWDPHGQQERQKVHDANVFVNVKTYIDSIKSLGHLFALLILQLKLLVDIRHIKISRKICRQYEGVPTDIQYLIDEQLVRSSLSRKFMKQSFQDLIKSELSLLEQVYLIGDKVVKSNGFFMLNLFYLDEALVARVNSYAGGSWNEMSIAMLHSYAAYRETQGLLPLMTEARAYAARDLESGVEDLAETENARTVDRSMEDVIAEVSANRIWGYLDLVIKDWSFLGPELDRPSARHMEENRKLWNQSYYTTKTQMKTLG